MISLSFLGAAHEVTGSCTLLKVNNYKILIDCGMEQGKDIYENCEIPINPADIDCILLTHSHIDHSGKIPMLTKLGFNGKIFLTDACARLCKLMLADSANIQEFEAEWRNRKATRSGKDLYEPLYTTKDVESTVKLFKNCHYNKAYKILPGVTAQFIDAGHLLGSASILITVNDGYDTQNILFSGDVGNINRPLIKDPTLPQIADYVIIESTYGDRIHGPREDYTKQLTDILTKTFERGGNVVIPSFAVGRTQELLYLLREIKTTNKIINKTDFKVYIDSPLASEVTNVYHTALREYLDEDALYVLDSFGSTMFFEGLEFSVTSNDSKAINFDNSPKVIIASSGMCEAGRIRHHLKHNLWKENSTILFVGYQSEGTLGRLLLDGAKSVKLFGEEIQVNAEIKNINGISGHADRDMLLNWLNAIQTTPKHVFVNHGEDTVCDEFVNSITTHLKLNATAPYNGAVYKLSNEGVQCISFGNNKKIIKEPKQNDLFNQLLDRGKKLLNIINTYKSSTISLIKQFIKDLDTIISKWGD